MGSGLRSEAQEAALHAARVWIADTPAWCKGWVCPFCGRWFLRKPCKWNRAFLVFRFHDWPCHPACLTATLPDPAECLVAPERRLPGRWWAWKWRCP